MAQNARGEPYTKHHTPAPPVGQRHTQSGRSSTPLPNQVQAGSSQQLVPSPQGPESAHEDQSGGLYLDSLGGIVTLQMFANILGVQPPAVPPPTPQYPMHVIEPSWFQELSSMTDQTNEPYGSIEQEPMLPWPLGEPSASAVSWPTHLTTTQTSGYLNLPSTIVNPAETADAATSTTISIEQESETDTDYDQANDPQHLQAQHQQKITAKTVCCQTCNSIFCEDLEGVTKHWASCQAPAATWKPICPNARRGCQVKRGIISRKNFWQHLKECVTKECPSCGVLSAEMSGDFKAHLKACTSSWFTMRLVCPGCDRVFMSPKYLFTHPGCKGAK